MHGDVAARSSGRIVISRRDHVHILACASHTRYTLDASLSPSADCNSIVEGSGEGGTFHRCWHGKIAPSSRGSLVTWHVAYLDANHKPSVFFLDTCDYAG